MAEAKTHRVRFNNGWIYEQPFPGEEILIVQVPKGGTAVIDDASYIGLMRNPSNGVEKIKDDEPVDFDIPDMVRQAEEHLVSEGKVVSVPPIRGTFGKLFGKGSKATPTETDITDTTTKRSVRPAGSPVSGATDAPAEGGK